MAKGQCNNLTGGEKGSLSCRLIPSGNPQNMGRFEVVTETQMGAGEAAPEDASQGPWQVILGGKVLRSWPGLPTTTVLHRVSVSPTVLPPLPCHTPNRHALLLPSFLWHHHAPSFSFYHSVKFCKLALCLKLLPGHLRISEILSFEGLEITIKTIYLPLIFLSKNRHFAFHIFQSLWPSSHPFSPHSVLH